MNIYQINLVHKLHSNVDFTIDVYPDTQVSATIPVVDTEGIYTIKSRFSNYQDLYKIRSINQILKDAGVKKVNLFCPYILASRSDQKFKINQSFDLKLVAQDINSCNFNEVTIIDPHSMVLPALINNSKPISAYDGFISWIPNSTVFWEDKTLVSPDAGAYKKLMKLAIDRNFPLIPGMKIRLKDNFPETQFFGDVKDKDIVIIDDICDGGRTFVELGAKIKMLGSKSITLLVTHGIFSKGIELENIDMIYTTNSFKSFLDTEISDKFQVINIF